MARHTTTRSLAIKEVAHQRRQFDTTFKHHKRGCLGSIAVGLAALGRAAKASVTITEAPAGSKRPCFDGDDCVYAWKSKVCYWNGWAAATYNKLFCSEEVKNTTFLTNPKGGSHAGACHALGQRGYFLDKDPILNFLPKRVDVAPGGPNEYLCIDGSVSKSYSSWPFPNPEVYVPASNILSYDEVLASYTPRYLELEYTENSTAATQPAQQTNNNDLGIAIGVPFSALAIGVAAVASLCTGLYLHKRHKTPCQVPNTVTPQTSVETKESNI